MFKTKFGAFDGNNWEALCQQVFKKKYGQDGYQHIPATPGDFGLEGYCPGIGVGFQCYCPNTHYTRKELHERQRDKITEDLGKLRTFQAQLSERLGDVKLSYWDFVTPEIAHNDLIAHIRKKEKEARSWNLPFLAPNFTIRLRDADYYLIEINQILAAAGQGLDFESGPAVMPPLGGPSEVYEDNILRKCEARLAPKKQSERHSVLVSQLYQKTLQSFLESDGYFRNIEKTAPVLYYKVARLISAFEHYVQEQQLTWTGPPEALTILLRQELEGRLSKLGPEMTDATAGTVARHMIARWIAVCSLDYD